MSDLAGSVTSPWPCKHSRNSVAGLFDFRIAALVYPITFLALLPAAPVFLGYTYANYLARWAACLFLSAVVTAGMFLFLQLAITLT